MRTLRLLMQVSADGYAAGPHNAMEWLRKRRADQVMEDYARALYNNADVMIVGRVLYQEMAAYFPRVVNDTSASPRERQGAQLMNSIPKIVYSRTLDKLDWQNCLLAKEIDRARIRALKEQPGKDIILAGGATIAREFIRRGLVDEYHIVVHPVVLGQGSPLFGGLEHALDLELVESRLLGSGVVLLHYRPAQVLAEKAA
ncbi:MAG: dihydrofolate reductase family protein [Anaerolineae bacterium]